MENIKLFIIEDEYLVRELIKKCLNWYELNIEIVGESGYPDEALELIDKSKPDIILSDICMPIKDGIEVCEEVVQKYPDIVIIMLTGYDKFEYAKRSVRLGAFDFILKPIDDLILKDTILKASEVIRKSRKQKKYFDRLLEENYRNKISEGNQIINNSDELKEILKGEEHVLINDIKTYIDENTTNEELGLSFIADRFYVNRSYLSRIFKEKFGETFTDYLNNRRITLALTLLQSTNFKAYEIADKVGFSNADYFGKCFKKKMGISVNEFRNRFN